MCYGNLWHLYKNYCLLTGATAWKHMCNVVIFWWTLSANSLVVSYSNSQKDWRLTHSINTQLLSKMHVCVWIFRFIEVVIKWLIEKRYFGGVFLIYMYWKQYGLLRDFWDWGRRGSNLQYGECTKYLGSIYNLYTYLRLIVSISFSQRFFRQHFSLLYRYGRDHT